METRSRMSRSLHTNRDFEKLEPYEGKPSRTVLRGEEGSNALDLPDRPSDLQQRDGRGVRAGNEIAKHFAENNVDVIIYAVEKSLDSYKFNLLHCKQTFISQLKSGAMGARTIDEGAMDEKSGMNFSEYMALLSGNTDLLDKAKLEKRIASLEGERKSFNKGKRDSEFKLYKPVGELYGFPIKVVSERTLKEGLEFTDNRFVVEGNYKYTYNNGHLAMADPIAAARNFLNALERIPTIIDQYKSKNEVLEKEIPQLQEIAGKVWKKEDELKQLKSELAALDRKIQLELAPAQENTEENRQGNEKKQTEQQPESPHVDFVRSHLIIGRPGLSESKGVKL